MGQRHEHESVRTCHGVQRAAHLLVLAVGAPVRRLKRRGAEPRGGLVDRGPGTWPSISDSKFYRPNLV
jgi:hypothetical protein